MWVFEIKLLNWRGLGICKWKHLKTVDHFWISWSALHVTPTKNSPSEWTQWQIASGTAWLFETSASARFTQLRKRVRICRGWNNCPDRNEPWTRQRNGHIYRVLKHSQDGISSYGPRRSNPGLEGLNCVMERWENSWMLLGNIIYFERKRWVIYCMVSLRAHYPDLHHSWEITVPRTSFGLAPATTICQTLEHEASTEYTIIILHCRSLTLLMGWRNRSLYSVIWFCMLFQSKFYCYLLLWHDNCLCSLSAPCFSSLNILLWRGSCIE